MEFLLLFNEHKGTPPPEKEGLAAMGKYSGELRKRGVLRRGAPLTPASAGAAIETRDGRVLVTDGPFAETKELVAGFWVIDVPDRAAALAIARECPHLQRGPIEIHTMGQRFTFEDTGKDLPFLLVFRMEKGLRDPDGAKLREMVAFCEELARHGAMVETAPLRNDPPAAHLETKSGKVLVTDGPFPETRELVGGYGVIRASDRASAIAMAKRFPHARWAPLEVREILFFDPV